jgi:hypothetical protein
MIDLRQDHDGKGNVRTLKRAIASPQETKFLELSANTLSLATGKIAVLLPRTRRPGLGWQIRRARPSVFAVL